MGFRMAARCDRIIKGCVPDGRDFESSFYTPGLKSLDRTTGAHGSLGRVERRRQGSLLVVPFHQRQSAELSQQPQASALAISRPGGDAPGPRTGRRMRRIREDQFDFTELRLEDRTAAAVQRLPSSDRLLQARAS